eukprot:scaffold144955_cov48-Attheya_sp.AAC.1
MRPLLSILLIVTDTRLLVDLVNLLIWTCAGFWQYRCRCDRAAATLLLTTAAVTIDVMGGVGFVDIPLVEDPAVERGGCGACGTGKGRNDGKRAETVFWGDTKPVVVVVCGAA